MKQLKNDLVIANTGAEDLIDKSTAELEANIQQIDVLKTKSGYGHVCICTGEGTTSYFYSYDQNWGRE